MDLTTVERVKVLLEARDNPGANQHLAILIDSVSRRVERRLERHTQSVFRTELFSVPYGTQRVQLRGYPVTSIARVWSDSARDFGIDDSTVDTTVSGTSAADQTDLTVTSSTGFAADDVIAVGEFTARDEELTIDSIPGATTIRCTTNLVYAHTAAQADAVLVSPVADVIDDDYYDVVTIEGKDIGLLWFDYELSNGANALKVKYTGGMAVDTDTFMTTYEDLATAVAKQVAFEWTSRGHAGFSDLMGAGGGRKQVADSDWLERHGETIPELVEAIASYKKVSV